MAPLRIAVVGAGPAGLCTARHFLAKPSQFDVVVFEQSNQVGGTWVYSDEVGSSELGHHNHSGMYESVKTNLPKQVMAFPDFPFDDSAPSFMGHATILSYLQRYSEHYGVAQHVKFNTRVAAIKPLSAHSTSAGSAGSAAGTRRMSVSVAGSNDAGSGASRQAELRDGSFKRSASVGSDVNAVLHSSSPKTQWLVTSSPASSMNGFDKSVLALETATFDAIFVCNGHYFDPVTPSVPGLGNFRGSVMHSHDYRRPEVFANQVVVVVGTGASGQDIGIDVGRCAKRVLVSASKAKWIKSPVPDLVQACHRISHINQDGAVVFSDGETAHADAIVFCTGYRYSYPFLDARCGVTVVENKCVRPLYKHCVNAVHPSMFFIGVPFVVAPFPKIDRQAQYALAVLEERHKLPSTMEMLLWQDKDLENRRRLQLSLRYAHMLASWQWEYNRDLAVCAGIPDLPSHYSALYDYTKDGRAFRLMTYRNDTFRLRSDSKLFDILPPAEK